MTVENIKAIIKGKIEALEDMFCSPSYYFKDIKEVGIARTKLETLYSLLIEIIEHEESNRTT
jgi:hypothetical protein